MSLWAALVLGLATTGCPDAEGNYDRFTERNAALNPPKPPGASCPQPCEAHTPAELAGEYHLVLSAVVGPAKPVMLFNRVTAEEGDEGPQMYWELTPIDRTDRETLIGNTINVGPFTVDRLTGCFEAPMPLAVPGEANPITGNPLEGDVVLSGQFRDRNAIGQPPDGSYACPAPADVACGDMVGEVTKPISVDLEGSTFTMLRLDYEPKPPWIDCAGNQAGQP